MKKVVTLFTAALVMAVLFPITALAAPGDTGAEGNFAWREVDGGKVEVASYLGTDTVITVPDTLNGMSVVGIGQNVFSSKPITSIAIPEGVKYLGQGAFAWCASLASVTLPDSVETMGAGCFYHCTALQSIVMKNNITTIGDSIFDGCTNLKNVTLSASLTSISANAFNGCGGLQNITIPGSVKLIGTSAFIGSGLTNIDIPGSVKTIGDAAFNSIKTLTSLTLHSGLETIGNSAFADCDNLGEVTIPSTVTSLGSNVFATCDNLNKVTILAETFSYTGTPFGGDPLSDGIYGFAGYTAQSIATSINVTFHTLGKVTYDSQGGPAVPWDYTLTGGTINALPSQPERQGFIFGGWWTAVNGGGTQFTASTPVAGNITVYAKWTPVLALAMSPADGKVFTGDKVTITPNIEGGTWSFNASYLSRDGNTFTGLKEGTARVTYTAGEQSKYVDVVIVKKLALTMSPADGKIFIGGKVTITPDIEGGTWSFDASYLSRDGSNFTGLKEGSVRVTYTVGEQSNYADVVITKKLALLASVSNGKIYSGGRITITPNIDGGTWSFDASYLSRDGNTFTGLKAGTVRVTYTAGGQTAVFDITVSKSELPKTGQDGTWICILAGVGLIALAGAAALKKAFNK